MKILLNRKPIPNAPYGGGNNFVKAFCELAIQAGHQIVHEFEDNIDVLLVLNTRLSPNFVSWQEMISYKELHTNCKLITRVNDCDERNGAFGADLAYSVLLPRCDATIFVSSWMKNYTLKENVSCQNNHVIYNGVDKSIFKPNVKINNGKINIVTHHWSDNELKDGGLNKFLDNFIWKHMSEFTFNHIGRTKYYSMIHSPNFADANRCGWGSQCIDEFGQLYLCTEQEKSNKKKCIHGNDIIDYLQFSIDYKSPMYGQALGNELGRYDVYISNSYADPGPNHCLEAISCGLPVYVSASGGGAVELAGADHTFKDFSELETILLKKDFKQNSTKLNSWEDCISSYLKVIENL